MIFFSSSYHLPIFLLLLLGLSVGIISGFYGIGGGWLITPVLNILGLPMSFAVGTSLVYVVITATFGTLSHRKLKHVSFISGIIIGISALVGIVFGRRLFAFFEASGNIDKIIRELYIFFLLGTSGYMFIAERHERGIPSSGRTFRRRIFSPYLVVFKEGTTTIESSLTLLMLVGAGIGLLNVTMGVGGGFILFPLLVYAFGFPVSIAVGTGLLSILLVVVQAAAVYVFSQRVHWPSVVAMVVMSIPGSFVGSQATKRVEPRKIKFLFAITVLSDGIAVILKQLNYSIMSTFFVYTIAIVTTSIIIYGAYIKNIFNRKKIEKSS